MWLGTDKYRDGLKNNGENNKGIGVEYKCNMFGIQDQAAYKRRRIISLTFITC